jgi:hypothetical protein
MAKQDDWRFCNKCHGLVWAALGANDYCFGDRGRQPSGGFNTRGHDVTGSWNFELVTEDEWRLGPPNHSQWKYCNKCRMLWWAFENWVGDREPYVIPGRCPAGGIHVDDGSWNFSVAIADVVGQDNWRVCQNCRGLWWAGNGRGVCIGDPAGHVQGTPADPLIGPFRDSANYILPQSSRPPAPGPR